MSRRLSSVGLFVAFWTMAADRSKASDLAPTLQYETVTGAKVTGKSGESFDGKTYNQRGVVGALGFPVVDNDDFMLGPWVNFAQFNRTWTDDAGSDRSLRKRDFLSGALFFMQKDEQSTLQFSAMYAQRRDLAFSFDHPLHDLSLCVGIKTGLFDNLIAGARWERLNLGLSLRQFPGTQRFIPYFSQGVEFGNTSLFIEFPGTISFKLKTADGQAKYVIASVIDDLSMTPFTYDDGTKGWGVDSYRVSFFLGYEHMIADPLVIAVKGGVMTESVDEFDLHAKRLTHYVTDLAPYLQLELTAWL